MKIVIICPSRGRPEAAAAMVESFEETTHGWPPEIRLCLDDDDPRLHDYEEMCWQLGLLVGSREGLAKRLNRAALDAVEDGADAVMFVGDDVRFVTPGWDVKFKEVLAEFPACLIYCADGIRDINSTSHPMISRAWIERMGWFARPEFHHYCFDAIWMFLSRAAGVLFYLPDVLIRHDQRGSEACPADELVYRNQRLSLENDDSGKYRAYMRDHFKEDARKLMCPKACAATLETFAWPRLASEVAHS